MKRNNFSSNESYDFKKTDDLAKATSWIYLIYHFSTGKAYVGQTIGTQQH